MSEEQFRELLRQPGGGASGGLLDIDSVMEFAIRVLRADFRVADNYRCAPGQRVSCPITAFRGRDDAGVSSQSVRAWTVCTADEFRWHELPGGHYFLYSAKELFLRRLSAELCAHQRQPAVPVA